MQKILIIEDDHRIVLALTVRLEREGYEVMFERDARVGVQRAIQGRLKPDLILLDVMLPGGNGMEVAQTLRDNPTTADVPVVFITASREPGLKERAAALEAAGFFEKPYDSSQLLRTVKDILRRDPAVEVCAM